METGKSINEFLKDLSKMTRASLLHSLPKKTYLDDLQLFAQKFNVPIVDPANGALLIHLIKYKQPSSILEIGAGLGFSTSLMESGMPDNSILVSVDHSHPSLVRAKRFYNSGANIRKALFVNGRGRDILSSIKHSFEFIFIDCNKDDYSELLDLSLKKIAKNGLIVFDNVILRHETRPEIEHRKYLKIKEKINSFLAKLSSLSGINFQILDQGDGLLVVY